VSSTPEPAAEAALDAPAGPAPGAPADATPGASGRSTLLADHTTIRLGGPATDLVWAEDEARLIDAVTAADASGAPLLLLGGGSNLVVADAGFDGVVARVAHRGIRFEPDGDGVRLHVASGEIWDDVVLASLTNGLAGLECLSGIPGLTGATPIQNVGAYGAEISRVITGVRAFDREEHTVVNLSNMQCHFGYRTSAFKRAQRHVILEVQISLAASEKSAPIRYAELAKALDVELGETAPTDDVRAAVLQLRAAKGMLIDARDPDSVSVGSFFTNPVLPAAEVPPLAPQWPAVDGHLKTSAAWLIEQAGFGRGYGVGRVGLSTKHTLALVNRGGASTSELIDFARVIRAGVRDRFGISLDVEPALVGVTL
jgi:UDP-N-acetylmuramate dehydrogenase